MEFAQLAAFTIHDVKNRLTWVANRAAATGDADTLRGVLEAAAALTRLLAFYKAENGQLGADIDAHVPADLVNELRTDISQQTALTISADLSAAPTLWFYDEALVRMVLLNGLYNALRFARKNVHITVVDRAHWLDFVIRDDGPGYPPEMLGDDRAARLEQSPISRHGTGIGLHLAQKIAALHQNGAACGSIELSNEGGAVFCLRLPK